MTSKQSGYDALVDDLAPFWQRDLALLERTPEAWAEARVIDDWLVQYRDDPRVGITQYERNCERLRALYHVGKNENNPRRIERTAG